MIFNSVAFALFLPIVLALYWSGRGRTRNVVLLVASYIFYGLWDWRFLGLLALSTAIDFTVALRLSAAPGELARRRKALLCISLAANLGILGFFKYFGFFVDSLASLGDSVGVNLSGPVIDVILPVGISFYTFQTMSYTIDVYRGRIEPARSLLDFATYVAYFPQLVAGPIERAHHLLPRIQSTATA